MEQDELYGKVYEIMTSQQFGVLATIENNLPHTSIIAFSITNNLKTILFITPLESRKYKNIVANPNVSLLVDHRPSNSKLISESYALSAIGTAKKVDLQGATATKELFAFCHADLAEKLNNPEYALMSLSVKKYEVVNGLTDVTEYKIG
jgi:general stress protein 26